MLKKCTYLFFLLALSLHGHRLAYSPEEFSVGQSKCFVLDGNSTSKEKPWVRYAPLYLGTLTPPIVGISINLSNKGLVLQGAIKEKYEDHLQAFPNSQIFIKKW